MAEQMPKSKNPRVVAHLPWNPESIEARNETNRMKSVDMEYQL